LLAGNTAGTGGGIANAGALTLDACRLIGNSARQEGGGIFNFSGQLTLRNGTVIGGTTPAEANQAKVGVGIANIRLGSVLTLTASHVIGNVATISVGGILSDAGASVTIVPGSTVVNNTPCDCNFDGCANSCL
jgi:hypothetical protein